MGTGNGGGLPARSRPPLCPPAETIPTDPVMLSPPLLAAFLITSLTFPSLPPFTLFALLVFPPLRARTPLPFLRLPAVSSLP